MEASISRFIRILRRTGIGVSPAEAIDALRALACVTITERETTRDVLRSALIKDVHDVPLFEDVFALFFGLPPANSPADAGESAATADGAQMPDLARVALDTEDDGLSLRGDGCRPDGRIKIQPGSLEEIARDMRIDRAQAVLDQLMLRASHQVNVRRDSNAARPGNLNFAESAPTLDADLMLDALEELLLDASGADASDESGAGCPASVLDRLPETLKHALRRRLETREEKGPTCDRRRAALPQRFSEAEHREMAELVRRLGRQMQGARSYRRVVGRHGRINVARTVRASMAYDGIPFRPVVSLPRNEKPRIVVICDVSLSVRRTARFMLHLVYSLQSLFEQVRSFVFVCDLAEVSQHFDRLGIDEAIAAILGGELIDCNASSNYGHALATFVARHLGVVTSETTVVILGDGRGNCNPPNVAALEEIRRRAKQLVWLSPEPRGSWGLGSSDMPLYEPVCHRAEVVRDLGQLGAVADALFRRSAAGAGHA